MSMVSREIALLLASMAFIVSFTYKFLIQQVSLTYVFRDFIVFFAVYFIAKTLLLMVDKLILNFRKIM